MQLFNRNRVVKSAEYDNKMFPESSENSSKNESLFLLDDNNFDKDMLNTLINLDNLNGSDIPRNMWGKRFELFLAKLFEHAGYKVEKVSEAGKPDNGIDLIIEKDNQRIAIQAKNYKLDGVYSVDKTTVQNFVGAIEIRKDITSGALITTHFFTENAIEVCSNLSPDNKKVELINREKLIFLIAKVYPELLAKAFFEKEIQIFPRCPQCGSITIKKKFNKETHESFYGCIHFPCCKGYVSIKNN